MGDPGAVGYTWVRNIDEGAFGRVVLSQCHRTGRMVAIKKLARAALADPRHREYVESEMVHMRYLVHPHIPRFIEVYTSPNDINCVMEYAAGGNLRDYLNRHQRLNEHTARRIFQQLISAVDYIHNAGVTNRDIKLDNILLKDPEPAAPWVMLVDFGFSKSIDQVARSAVGTHPYMAHEVLLNFVNQAADQYNARLVDVWSCGVVLFTMLAYAMPFGSGNAGQVLREIEAMEQQQRLPLPAGLELTPQCLDLLRRMLQPDPAQRITIQQITRHDWYLDCRQSEDDVRAMVNSAVPAAAPAAV